MYNYCSLVENLAIIQVDSPSHTTSWLLQFNTITALFLLITFSFYNKRSPPTFEFSLCLKLHYFSISHTINAFLTFISQESEKNTSSYAANINCCRISVLSDMILAYISAIQKCRSNFFRNRTQCGAILNCGQYRIVEFSRSK